MFDILDSFTTYVIIVKLRDIGYIGYMDIVVAIFPLTRAYAESSEFFWFDGRHLELKIPDSFRWY